MSIDEKRQVQTKLIHFWLVFISVWASVDENKDNSEINLLISDLTFFHLFHDCERAIKKVPNKSNYLGLVIFWIDAMFEFQPIHKLLAMFLIVCNLSVVDHAFVIMGNVAGY